MTRLLDRLGPGRRPTGIDRVCQAYVERYGPGGRALIRHRWFTAVASADASRRLFADLLEGRADRRRALVRALASSAAPPEGAWLFHVGHSGLEHPGFAGWLRARRLRPVYMVHDLIPISHPEYCRPGESARHARRLDTMLATAACLVTNSSATLASLRAYAATRTGRRAAAALASPIAPHGLPPGGPVAPLAGP